MQRTFPDLICDDFAETRDALQVYTQIIGDWRAACLPRRKHWWQLSVYPSVRGLTTGMIHSSIDFELELDLQSDRLHARIADGCTMSEPLGGRPGRELAAALASFLTGQGIDPRLVPDNKQRHSHDVMAPGYSSEVAGNLAAILRSISAALTVFRSRVSEETSPIQLWPHHFDLAMLYLPGEKVPGQDPANEELSDKQLNFGFIFGDEFIPEPYFYVTAYPLPDGLTAVTLPDGTQWQSDGFSGAVLLYRRLLEETNPWEYLVGLWNGLLSATHAR